MLCIPERESTAQLPKVTLTLKYEPVPHNGPGFSNLMKSAIAFLFDSTLKKHPHIRGQSEDSHLWYLRDHKQKTLLTNSNYPDFDQEMIELEQGAKRRPQADIELREGTVLHWSYDEHSFEGVYYRFKVVKRAPYNAAVDGELLPRCEAAAERSEFSLAEKLESDNYRRQREALAHGGRLIFFSRGHYRRTRRDGGDGMRDLPSRGWSCHETAAMSLLIEAGVGFMKAWKTFLQYAFLDRSEAATSNKYYATKKHAAPLVDPSTASKATRLAKAFRFLESIREGMLNTESIAYLEGLSAKAWSDFHRYEEYTRLLHKRGDELTEEDMERQEELEDKIF